MSTEFRVECRDPNMPSNVVTDDDGVWRCNVAAASAERAALWAAQYLDTCMLGLLPLPTRMHVRVEDTTRVFEIGAVVQHQWHTKEIVTA